MNKGTTFVELIIYTAIVSVVLTLLFQFYGVAISHKTSELVRNELAINGEIALTDIAREIKNASSITDPIIGTSAPALTLDTGIIFTIDGNDRLSKTDGVTTAPITTDKVLVDSIMFEHLGPSSSESTITVHLELRAIQTVEGETFTQSYQTATTLRK